MNLFTNNMMTIVTSWDDGKRQDIRLAELLLKYPFEAKHIFFLSNKELELSYRDIKWLAEHFEIGGHTMTHPSDMKMLKGHFLKDDIELNKIWLEDIIHKKLKWFCYPRGRYNDIVISVVKSCGFKYARTTLVGNTDFSQDLFRIHPTVHVYPTRQEYGGQNWVEYAKGKFLEAKLKNGYFHLWGHSWEVENFQLWDELEHLLKFIYEHSYK